jgi:glycosyltransferase involved in cell wall biosynthesis
VSARQSSEPSLQFVIPYYGDAGLLRQTVESVLQQRDPRWTLTIVEDGQLGTGVRNWVEHLDEDRVRYEVNERTLGVAGNFQRCLDLADDDYVVFLGSDDRLLPTYVGHVHAAIAEHADITILQPGVRVIDDLGVPIQPIGDRLKSWLNPTRNGPVVMQGEALMASLMRGNWAYFPSVVWRREALAAIGFRQDLQIVLDLVALVTLVLDGARLLVTDEVVFEYRRHRSSTSSVATVTSARFVEERRAYTEFDRMARDKGWRRAARASRRHVTSRMHAALLVPGAVRAGNWRICGAYLRHVFGS